MIIFVSGLQMNPVPLASSDASILTLPPATHSAPTTHMHTRVSSQWKQKNKQ